MTTEKYRVRCLIAVLVAGCVFVTGSAWSRTRIISGHAGGARDCVAGNDASAVLMIHSNTTDGSTTFVDSGNAATSPKVITVLGHTHHEVDEKKFGTTAIYFDGTTDALRLDDHADWTFGSDKFTVDFWLYYPSSVPVNDSILGQLVDVNAHWHFELDNSSLRFLIRNTALVISLREAVPSLVADTWHHIAVIRGWGGNANDWALTVDGSSVATATDSDAVPAFAGYLYIGYAYQSGLGLQYVDAAYMDEIRISAGVARWTSNFTPPVKPYCD